MSLTERWVRLYTSGLPEQVRRERCEEIASDVFEQYAAARHTWAARRAVAGRTVRGAVDDLVWRREVARGMNRSSMKAVVTQAWWAPVAALVALFDIALAVGVLADDGSTMPGRVLGPALVLLAAAAMVAGLIVRTGATRPAGRHGGRWFALLVLLTVVAALTLGGPVVLGVAVVVCVAGGAVLLGGHVRSAGTADALVLVGTLPALAMFWLVLPAVLALAVIIGVLTTRSREVTAPA